MSWREQAACRGHDTDLWFPEIEEEEDGPRRRETPRLYRQAKRICLSCEVREECLDYALEANEQFGMWGGLTRPERATILRQRRRDAKQ